MGQEDSRIKQQQIDLLGNYLLATNRPKNDKKSNKEKIAKAALIKRDIDRVLFQRQSLLSKILPGKVLDEDPEQKLFMESVSNRVVDSVSIFFE